MAIFRFFKMAAAAILDYRNFKFLTMGAVKRVELRHHAKFRWNRPKRGRDIAIYRFFKMAAAAILDFQNKIFNGCTRHEWRTASLCQISSKSLETRPRYVSFNIMLVWLENAYSCPFLGSFWGTFPPNDVTHRPNSKKDHPWAEPRHLSHKPRKSVARFELGVWTRKKGQNWNIF